MVEIMSNNNTNKTSFQRFKESRDKNPNLREVYNVLSTNGFTVTTRCGVEMEKTSIFIAVDATKASQDTHYNIWFQSNDESEWDEQTKQLQDAFKQPGFVTILKARNPQNIGPRS